MSNHERKIAIIGGGTSGLGSLKALLDIPQELRNGWQIDLYEQRDGIGGIWHPEGPGEPLDQDGLPETPIYPTLGLNTVHPTITFPKFPFPPETPLLPHYSYMSQYHLDFAATFKLTPHIHVSHAIQSADWNPSSQKWRLTVLDRVNGRTLTSEVDHLIVGNGHNHYPKVPSWYSSRAIWVKNGGDAVRQVLHSIRYRDPAKYVGHTVVVVGFGASGWDIATQTAALGSHVYHSYNPETRHTKIPPVPGTTQVPLISSLTTSGIHFEDGSYLATPGPTTIFLATGYELRVPFLSLLTVDRDLSIPPPDAPTRLATNLALIRPLHRQIFAIDDRLPRNALAFIGLPVPIANGPSSYAQGIYAAHGIADAEFLPGKREALEELEVEEERQRSEGHDPLLVGHRLYTNFEAYNYQDELVATIRRRSRVPLPDFLREDVPYTEPWRIFGRSPEKFLALNRGWKQIVAEGREFEYIKGARTEEDYEAVMHRVYEFGAALPAPVVPVVEEVERGRPRFKSF